MHGKLAAEARMEHGAAAGRRAREPDPVAPSRAQGEGPRSALLPRPGSEPLPPLLAAFPRLSSRASEKLFQPTSCGLSGAFPLRSSKAEHRGEPAEAGHGRVLLRTPPSPPRDGAGAPRSAPGRSFPLPGTAGRASTAAPSPPHPSHPLLPVGDPPRGRAG